jgi:O-antigen/teichoic acid export membrane protein/glycosyltransferase involved in cell wall biosynthesis
MSLEPTARTTNSVGQQILEGAGWMVLLRVADRLIGVFSFTILARLLLPEHFGMVALASSVIAIGELFSELGVELALIQSRHDDKRLYNAAWTLRILRAFAMGIVYLILARPAASFFNEPRLDTVIYVLALTGFIQAWENIGVVEFRKSLAFNREFQYLFLSRCLAVPVAISMAYMLRTYWALLGGILAQKVIQVLLSYLMHSFRPKFSTVGVRTLLDFSKWMALQNLISGLSSRAPAFVLGRLSDVAALGFFNVAHEFASMATTELRAPVRKALFPGFVKWSSDVAKLRTGLLETYGLLALVSLPIPVLLGLMAPLLVQVFLGQAWLPAIPMVQILALYGVVQALGTSSHVIYLAINKLRFTTMLSALHLALLVPLLVWGVSRFGAAGAAWALAIVAVVVLSADIVLVSRVLGIRPWAFIRSMIRPLVASVGMFLTLSWLSLSAPVSAPIDVALVRLVTMVLLAIATYFGFIVMLWRLCGKPEGAERRLIGLASTQWTRLQVRTSDFIARPGHEDRTSDRIALRTPYASRRSAIQSMIMFGGNQWNDLWQTRQHIGAQFAQLGWRVIYSNGQLHTFQRGDQVWRTAPWFKERRVQDNVVICTAGRLQSRCLKLPQWDEYALQCHARDLMDAAGWKDASRRILYVFRPEFWPYVKYLDNSCVIYHADDAFSLMPGWTAEDDFMQASLVTRADLVLASSNAMARLLPEGGAQRARLFPNAADARAYMNAVNQRCPDDLQRISHPRIGYVGSLNLKVNFSLIATVAVQKPEWQWVLVGPILESAFTPSPGAAGSAEGLSACRKLANVHFLGPKSVRNVARYMAHMDVNTMCYRNDPGGWWNAIYPLKLHEYLAVGHPVVTTDIESVRPFSSVLAIVDSPEAWIDAIADALSTGGVGTRRERQQVALANTWEQRIDQLVKWLDEAGDGRSPNPLRDQK